MRLLLKIFCLLLALVLIKLIVVIYSNVENQNRKFITNKGNLGAVSNLPLPRFVSLKATRTNVRVGPGAEYEISWTFVKAGLPVELLQEYDNWRYIRDYTGSEGWIAASLLTGKRRVIMSPLVKNKANYIFAKKATDSYIVAKVMSGALGEVSSCDGTWCKVKFDKASGWIRQNKLWGVYPEEIF